MFTPNALSLFSLFFLLLSLGCDLGFTDEADDNSLPFFPSGSGNFINVPANQNCSFYFANELHVNYLRCDGTWKSQSLSNVIEVTSGWSISQLSIKVSDKIFNLPLLIQTHIVIKLGALDNQTTVPFIQCQ